MDRIPAVGEKVILGKHDNAGGAGSNWTSEMDQHVGKIATVTGNNRHDGVSAVVSVAEHPFSWRVVNLTEIEPTPEEKERRFWQASNDYWKRQWNPPLDAQGNPLQKATTNAKG